LSFVNGLRFLGFDRNKCARPGVLTASVGGQVA
jgi:hypothetical protein